MDYIKREDALHSVCIGCNKEFSDEPCEPDGCAIRMTIENIPSTNVVEVKHACWEEYWDDDYLTYFHRCSECKNDAPAKQETYCDQILTTYCPNCGAKMDGGKK